MKSNWIEIKRFLNDHKRFILIGSIITAIAFGIMIYTLEMLKERSPQEEEADTELSSIEILNDAQPAYFQLYLEREDGTEYGNSHIINQYFNLDSVKEKIKEDTGIDIKSIEEEVYLNDLEDDIKIINVRRNDGSFLFTASFNLGSERKNIIIAEYYYDLLLSDNFPILEDKKTYVFEEPKLAKKPEENLITKELDKEKKDLEPNSLIKDIVNHIKNIVIGLVLGFVLMTGIALLKVIFGKTLDYSFAYEVEDEDKFFLYDKELENKDLMTQFIAYPFKNKKIILSEESIDLYTKNILTTNKQLTFDKNIKDKKILTNIQSLFELEIGTPISEIIIIIYPKLTTRKWYKKQREYSEINKIPVKIIQINN